jgi:hypothetical protein
MNRVLRVFAAVLCQWNLFRVASNGSRKEHEDKEGQTFREMCHTRHDYISMVKTKIRFPENAKAVRPSKNFP